MFKKLLVPIDGSAPSTAAVKLAVNFARDQGADLIFAHVHEIEPYGGWEGTVALPSDPDQEFDPAKILERARSEAAKAGLEATIAIKDGDVVEVLLNLADTKGADLIVMGSHGRSGIARALIGSKAEGLMRHSPIPVLVATARLRP